MFSNQLLHFADVVRRGPMAVASIKGNDDNKGIYGNAMFYQTKMGVLVFIELFGLNRQKDNCDFKIYPMHIHSGTSCNSNNMFEESLGHFNPNGCEHPYHAGDMPPVFNNNGYGAQVFLTNRFSVKDIIGKVVIVHDGIDDFTSQPSGNAGNKIACGEIKRNY